MAQDVWKREKKKKKKEKKIYSLVADMPEARRIPLNWNALLGLSDLAGFRRKWAFKCARGPFTTLDIRPFCSEHRPGPGISRFCIRDLTNFFLLLSPFLFLPNADLIVRRLRVSGFTERREFLSARFLIFQQ